LKRYIISPIELNVANTLIPNNFPQSGDEGYNFYKDFHFPIRYNPFVCVVSTRLQTFVEHLWQSDK